MITSEPTLKHSTTLLATLVTLRILIVINWILGALIFALLAISFQAVEWTWRALGVGAVSGHGDRHRRHTHRIRDVQAAA